MELMVVVALIGVLSAVATAKYRAFVFKARTVEAKLALSNAYTVEKAFYGEKGSYTACLRRIGYAAGDTPRYYAIGFSGTGGNACGNGTEDCLLTDFGGGGTTCNGAIAANSDLFVPANAGTNPQLFPQSVGNARPSANSFVVGACGVIDSGYDEWSINSIKIMIHLHTGY